MSYQFRLIKRVIGINPLLKQTTKKRQFQESRKSISNKIKRDIWCRIDLTQIYSQ